MLMTDGQKYDDSKFSNSGTHRQIVVRVQHPVKHQQNIVNETRTVFFLLHKFFQDLHREENNMKREGPSLGA